MSEVLSRPSEAENLCFIPAASPRISTRCHHTGSSLTVELLPAVDSTATVVTPPAPPSAVASATSLSNSCIVTEAKSAGIPACSALVPAVEVMCLATFSAMAPALRLEFSCSVRRIDAAGSPAGIVALRKSVSGLSERELLVVTRRMRTVWSSDFLYWHPTLMPSRLGSTRSRSSPLRALELASFSAVFAVLIFACSSVLVFSNSSWCSLVACTRAIANEKPDCSKDRMTAARIQ